MKKKVGRPKAGKSELSKAVIIEVAMNMVDDEGIEAFSMRKLATRLSVNPMAVYYHLKNKKAVLNELVKKAIDFSGFDAGDCSQGVDNNWKEAVKRFARYYLTLFRAHRDLMLHLIANPASGSETVYTGNEILYTILQGGGLSPTNIIRLADIIVDYLNGFGLAESTGRIPDNDERIAQNQQWLETPESDNYPTTKTVLQMADGKIATDFELGLDCLLAGIDSFQELD